MRFFLPHDLHADFGVAVPLSYRSPDNARRSPRFLFTLSSAFRLCPERGNARSLQRAAEVKENIQQTLDRFLRDSASSAFAQVDKDAR